MKRKEAEQKVKEHLHRVFVAGGCEPAGTVGVEWWQRGSKVAEVSFAVVYPDGGMGGFAFMQSDLPVGLAVCAQVERCVEALRLDGAAEWVAEEYENLNWLLNYEEPTAGTVEDGPAIHGTADLGGFNQQVTT